MRSLTAILSVSDDGIIGVEGPCGPRVPWRLPPVDERFHELTRGRAVIMGRRTYEAIGKALPSRHNIVLSWRAKYAERPQYGDCFTAYTPEGALKVAYDLDTSPVVIGGASVFREFWPLMTLVELTEVHCRVGEGRRFAFGRYAWRETLRRAGEYEGLRYDVLSLERRTLAATTRDGDTTQRLEEVGR